MQSALDVLIFSHMYPSPERPVLGCFVEAQAKALIEHADLKVVVVTGIPFGLSFQTPGKLLKSVRHYLKALKAAQWEDHPKSPPVLRVPFCINRHWLPFPIRAFSYALALLLVKSRLLTRGKPARVHAHTAYLDGSAARLLAALWKRPYWITEHTLDPPGPYATYYGHPITRAITRWALMGSQGLIAVSLPLAQAIKAFGGRRVSPVRVVPNFVDTTVFYPPAVPTVLAESHQPFRVLFVGSLDENKNPLLLLEMLERYRPNNLSLTLVGEGPLWPELETRIAASPFLQSTARLLPNQPRVQLAEIMREECDVLVLPSEQETFGIVLIEAMACGKPVIATRCGGPESILTEPFLGLLISKNDPLTLFNSIETIRHTPAHYPPQKIREEAVERYSVKPFINALTTLYQTPA